VDGVWLVDGDVTEVFAGLPALTHVLDLSSCAPQLLQNKSSGLTDSPHLSQYFAIIFSSSHFLDTIVNWMVGLITFVLVYMKMEEID
jgi:hypothetical protein